jgi:hypothetical protein
MSANEPANATANDSTNASTSESASARPVRKIDKEEIEMYMSARGDVFGDPDKFGVAMIVAYVHRELPVTVEYISSSQNEIGMHLTRKRIEKFLEKWLNKGYVERSEAGYVPTKKMILALKADGITKESLDRMAEALYRTKS